MNGWTWPAGQVASAHVESCTSSSCHSHATTDAFAVALTICAEMPMSPIASKPNAVAPYGHLSSRSAGSPGCLDAGLARARGARRGRRASKGSIAAASADGPDAPDGVDRGMAGGWEVATVSWSIYEYMGRRGRGGEGDVTSGRGREVKGRGGSLSSWNKRTSNGDVEASPSLSATIGMRDVGRLVQRVLKRRSRPMPLYSERESPLYTIQCIFGGMRMWEVVTRGWMSKSG